MKIKNKTFKKINLDAIMKILDTCYEKSITGLRHVSPPIDKLAEEYLSSQPDLESAIKAMHKNQISKCTTSGFITGFGGALTMPVTIPANLTSVIYVQMRMISCTAYMCGFDLNSDQVQTFVYACLAGVSVNEFIKKFGVKFSNKMATKAIEKIPTSVLKAINRKLGTRLLTKFGEKGFINLGKMVPVLGAGVNGALDNVETRIIANRAFKMFYIDLMDRKNEEGNDEIID